MAAETKNKSNATRNETAGKMSGSNESSIAPELSVVVPTYREAENIEELCKRLFAGLETAGISAELIIVDDNSRDGTVEKVADLALQYPIRILVREYERGLSSAVVYGFEAARADILVCIDADLSHPPERVADIYSPVHDGEVEFCIGSRYVDGADISDDWSAFRALNSQIATALARPLTTLRDPMAGFFCTTKQTYLRAVGNGLKPIGYKIGLEICVRGKVEKTSEVAIHFDDRRAGESKLGAKQQAEYILQLALLYFSVHPVIFIIGIGTFCAALAAFALLFSKWFL